MVPGAASLSQQCRGAAQRCCGDTLPVGEWCCGAQWARGGERKVLGLPGSPGAGMGMGRGTGMDAAQSHGAGASQGSPHGATAPTAAAVTAA